MKNKTQQEYKIFRSYGKWERIGNARKVLEKLRKDVESAESRGWVNLEFRKIQIQTPYYPTYGYALTGTPPNG